MAIAFVQSDGAYSDAAIDELTIAFDSNVTAGNAIFACASENYTGNTGIAAGDVHDSLSNTYTIEVQAVTTSGGVHYGGICYALNIAGGACTVHCNPGTNAGMILAIAEFSGVATSSASDGESIGADSFTTDKHAGSIDPSDNSVIIGYYFNNGSSTASITEDGDQTLFPTNGERQGTSGIEYSACYKITDGTAYNMGWTLSASKWSRAVAAAFKPATGGASAVPVIVRSYRVRKN